MWCFVVSFNDFFRMETNKNDVYLSQYKLEQFVEIVWFFLSFGDYRKVIGTHNNIM